jgi:hypothetical protein
MNPVERAPGWTLLGICIVGIFIGWVLFRWLRGSGWFREGFQVVSDEAARTLTENEALAYDMLQYSRLQCTTFTNERANTDPGKVVIQTYLETNKAAIKERFWKYVEGYRKPMDDPESMKTPIENVMFPRTDDTYQVVFPLYMSIYALAMYDYPRTNEAYKSNCARLHLFDYYTEIQVALTSTVSDPVRNAQWDTDPLAQSCVSLSVAETNLRQVLSLLRAGVQDVSGSVLSLERLRDENMKFQNEVKPICTTTDNNPSQPCKDLASQDPILFGVLPEFDTVMATGYDKEEDISDVLESIGQLYRMLRCDVPTGLSLTFSMDDNAGIIDTETLRIKLQTLSPYYLSPDVMNKITSYLISPDEVQGDLLTANNRISRVKQNVSRIKTIAGVP